MAAVGPSRCRVGEQRGMPREEEEEEEEEEEVGEEEEEEEEEEERQSLSSLSSCCLSSFRPHRTIRKKEGMKEREEKGEGMG